MFVHYRSQGFVLKKEERGEADQLLTIYTKDFGKLEILGRGIRKISSKLRSGAEIFYLSEIEFIQGKREKILTDAILIDKFANLRRNLKKLKIAYQITEVLDNLVSGQEADEKIWQLLNEVFQKLNNRSLVISHWSLLYYYFLWNLLSLLGYKPELYQCSFCQKKLIPEKLYFSPKEGGVICQNCFKKNSLAQEISPDLIKILRIILEKNWPTLSKLKIEQKYLKSLKSVSENYLRCLKEK